MNKCKPDEQIKCSKFSFCTFFEGGIEQCLSAWGTRYWRRCHHQPLQLADHGGAEQHGRQPNHRLERANGRGLFSRVADSAGLHFPGPLLLARADGRRTEGLNNSLNGHLKRGFQRCRRRKPFFVIHKVLTKRRNYVMILHVIQLHGTPRGDLNR